MFRRLNKTKQTHSFFCFILELGAELSQEYTDSPYTSNSHREKIIMLNERVLLELNQLLRIGREMVRVLQTL